MRRADTVKFADVKQNIGGGYDSSTGNFTCPISGVYNFAVHLMSSSGTYMEVNRRYPLLENINLILKRFWKHMITGCFKLLARPFD